MLAVLHHVTRRWLHSSWVAGVGTFALHCYKEEKNEGFLFAMKNLLSGI